MQCIHIDETDSVIGKFSFVSSYILDLNIEAKCVPSRETNQDSDGVTRLGSTFRSGVNASASFLGLPPE